MTSENQYYKCVDGAWEVTEASSNRNVAFVDPSTVVRGTVTDERDGQTYKTVKIGSQVWMAENLNYATTTSYSSNDLSCDTPGRLYSWAAAVGKIEGECVYAENCNLGTGNIRGICPKGWHLPSNEEWNTLFTAVGDSSVAGKMLKSTSGWKNNGNGSDKYGFSALPDAREDDWGRYYNDSSSTCFWSSTMLDDYYVRAYAVMLGTFDAVLLLTHDGMNSVRCLKD